MNVHFLLKSSRSPAPFRKHIGMLKETEKGRLPFFREVTGLANSELTLFFAFKRQVKKRPSEAVQSAVKVNNP